MNWRGLWICAFMFIFPQCSLLVQPSYAADSTFSLVGPSELILHQDEKKNTYITIHNTHEEMQTFTLTIQSLAAPIEAVNFPVSDVLVENHLKQFQLEFYAPSNATFGTYPATIQVQGNDETEFFHLNITVAPYSDLEFWVGESSELLVDGGVRASVALNITNNASFTDDVRFDLFSSSTWSWGWSMDNVVNDSAYLSLPSSTLKYIYFWIDIPTVQHGMPLEGTGPTFSLHATSNLDQEVSIWNLHLKMNTFRNVSIDGSDGEILLPPGEDGRLMVNIRNNGNIQNNINITLQALDEDGDVLPNIPASDRFSSDGWTIALFGGLEDVELQPNETRTVEIGFQSPDQFEGASHVRVIAFAGGAIERTSTIDVSAKIQRNKSIESSYNSTGCLDLLPNQSCTSSITIHNKGNARDTYLLRLTEPSAEVEVELPPDGLTIQNGFTDTFENIIFTGKNSTIAFQTGEVEIELLDDEFRIIQLFKIPYKIAPYVQWNFLNVTESIDDDGMMNIKLNVRNEGNAIDGLLVQLQSSHNTEMAFIPPFIAEVEDGVERPRSFEVNNIPLGYNFTIEAWVQLPTDQNSNGTVYINTSIRSKFSPETEFVHTSEGNYIGIPWQNMETNQQQGFLSSFIETSFIYLDLWFGVIISILISGLILFKAITDREKRLEQESEIQEPIESKAEETENDWLAKFQKKQTSTHQDEIQHQVPKAAFETMFKMRAQPKDEAQIVDEAVQIASKEIIEKGNQQRRQDEANQLLSNIQTHGIAQPHQMNKYLQQGCFRYLMLNFVLMS